MMCEGISDDQFSGLMGSHWNLQSWWQPGKNVLSPKVARGESDQPWRHERACDQRRKNREAMTQRMENRERPFQFNCSRKADVMKYWNVLPLLKCETIFYINYDDSTVCLFILSLEEYENKNPFLSTTNAFSSIICLRRNSARGKDFEYVQLYRPAWPSDPMC